VLAWLGDVACVAPAVELARRGEPAFRGVFGTRFRHFGDVRDLVRLAVGGEHDLLVVLVERVERVKNSSCVLSLPARNCTSSISSTSMPSR
jgi:hypothetical protein